MGGGGVATKREQGASQVLTLKKGGGGAEQVLAVLKGGGPTQSFEVVLMQELGVLAILMGGTQSFHPLKGGGRKDLPCIPVLRGGGRTKFLTRDFPILLPPPPRN